MLIADAEGAAVVPGAVRERWDCLHWVFETSGTTALARLRTGVRPQLVIINLQLPDQCGTELAERLKKGRPGLPLLVTSNVAGVLGERVARSLGVVAYLVKPLNAVVLDQVLRSVLRMSDSAAEHAVGSDTVGGE
ncbi:MAG: response regulator [Phycisphaerae bacterium]|nr:response regulator [Phycisphaerae bacterium]